MRLGWRLCRRAHADLSGEGARLHGGRWNSPGRRVVYLGSTPELCVLEVRVHLDLPPDLVPDDYVLMRVSLGGMEAERVPRMPADPRAFGDRWLAEARSPLLDVPSALLPESRDLLLDPSHPRAAAAAVEDVRPFAFDRRLWLPL